MANPLNRLQKAVKSGTGLFGTSDEEMSSLANAAGRSQQPATPLEGSVLGGTPDQAKMMGTSAGKLGALRQQIRGEMDLGTQTRQEQARKAQTAEEQAAAERQQSLVGLGDMQSRVQQIADKMFTGQGAAQIEQALAVNDAAIDQAVTDPTTAAQLKAILAKLGNNTATNQDILQAANLLGFTQVADIGQVKQQLVDSFLTKGETAGQFIAGQVADNVLVSNLSPEQLQQLGFQDTNDLATKLGVDPATIGSMSVQQVQQAVTNLQQAEYSHVQRLKDTMASPAASQQDKLAAANELRNLGGAGVRATEADYAKFNEAVQRGDEIEFGGETRTLDELLSDQYISGLVKNYFDDPAEAAKISAREPEFAKWIEANRAVLEQAAKDVDEDIAGFAKIQEDNRDLINIQGAGSLSDAAETAIFGDQLRTLQADVITPPTLIQQMKSGSVSAGTASALLSGLNQIASIGYDGIAKNMTDLDAGTLARKGLADSAGVAKYTNYLTQAKYIQDSTVPEDVVSTALGNTPIDRAQQAAVDSKVARDFFGDNISSNELQLLDANGDGQLDSTEQMAAAIKGAFKPFEAAQIGNVDDLMNMGRGVTNVINRIQSLDATKRALIPALRDGKFDANDAQNYINSVGNNLGQMESAMATLARAPGGAVPGVSTIKGAIEQRATDAINSSKKGVALFQGSTQQKLTDKMNIDPISKLNPGLILGKPMTGGVDNLWYHFNDVWRTQQDYTPDEWNTINDGKRRLEDLLNGPDAQQSPTYKRKVQEQIDQINAMIDKRNDNYNKFKAEFDKIVSEGLQQALARKDALLKNPVNINTTGPSSRESRKYSEDLAAVNKYILGYTKWLENGWNPMDAQAPEGYRK